jgi:hypothetical protein
MGSGDEPELRRRSDPGKGHELLEIVFVCPPSVRVVDVGEPLGFRGDVGELGEFGAGEGPARERARLWSEAAVIR